jgi:general L-amino acid transport system permease protein
MIAQLRQRLFATPIDAAITLVCLIIVWRISVPLVHWLLIDATWHGTSRDDCKGSGACWVFVRMRFGQFMYGQYPSAERWRVDIVGALWVLATAALSWRGLPHRRGATLAAVLVLPVLGIVLLHGGWGTGLRMVETREWGGLMLTLFLTIYAGLIAIPLGILLALGRRSNMPMIKGLCVGFIELIRGVPLISLLIMASVMLPLFLPTGMSIDKFLRAQVAVILFAAAYIAEIIRGGLQSLPKGQFEAADAMGLNYVQKTVLIILPQALRVVIPPLINTFIGFFKDTSLVLIIGIFDFLNTANQALVDPNWAGFPAEVYLFAAFVYFCFCFSMSRYSKYLEVELNKGTRR